MKVSLLNIPDEGMHIRADVLNKASENIWFAKVLKEAFEKDYQEGQSADIEMDVVKTCDNVCITGITHVNLNPTCDLCVERFLQPLSIPFKINLVPATSSQRDEEQEQDEIGDEGEHYAFYRGGEVDLNDLIREMLVLEIPFRYLCSEDCKGLCVKCGHNLNEGLCPCPSEHVSSQFGGLKDLLAKKSH